MAARFKDAFANPYSEEDSEEVPLTRQDDYPLTEPPVSSNPIMQLSELQSVPSTAVDLSCKSIGVGLHWLSFRLSGEVLGIDRQLTGTQDNDPAAPWPYSWPGNSPSSGKPPLPHQVNGALRILSSIWGNDPKTNPMFHPRLHGTTFLIADEVGAGKTLLALLIIGYLSHIGNTLKKRDLPPIMHIGRRWLIDRKKPDPEGEIFYFMGSHQLIY